MATEELAAAIADAAVGAGIDVSKEAVAFALGYSTAMNAPKLNTDPFTIYHHEEYCGQAQAIYMMLADAGVEFERKSPQEVTDPTIFAVPAVECGGEWRSQTLAVIRFIAERIGYEVPFALSTISEKLSLDFREVWDSLCMQYKVGLVPDHWIETHLKRWLKVRRLLFLCGRCGEFIFLFLIGRLQCLNATVTRTSQPFCIGSSVSFADFLLLNLVLLLEVVIGDTRAKALLSEYAPAIITVSDATRHRPKVAAYLSYCAEPLMCEASKVRHLK